MSGALEVAGDIASASTALAGLLLVFLGSVANSYESFDAVSQKAVVKKYSSRAILVLIGFFASLIAAVTAIWGKWESSSCLVDISAVALFASLLVISIGAVLTVRDVR